MAAPSEIEKLERRYAENPDGRFFAPLADAYRKAGNLVRALELVRAGLGKHPDYLSAHIVLGRCLLDKGDDVEAEQTFRSVLELDAENIIALKSLAEISERTGRSVEARRWLQKLLAVDSMNSEAEADLQRLGGVIAEQPTQPIEAVTPAGVAADAGGGRDARVSFADVAAEVGALLPFAPTPPPAPAPPSAAPEPSVAAQPQASPDAVTVPVPAMAVPVRAPEPPPVTTAVTAEMTAEVQAAAVPAPAPAAQEVAPAAAAPAPPPMEGFTPIGSSVEAPPAAPQPEPALPDHHPLGADLQVAESGLDLMPFDDSLAWGTGERSSRAIRAEDLAAFSHDDALTTPAAEFLSEIDGGTAPAEPPVPESPPQAGNRAEAGEYTIERSGEMPIPLLDEAGARPPEEIELPAELSATFSLGDAPLPGPPPAPAPLAEARPSAPAPLAEARPSAPAPLAEARPSAGLPLIMPEDVTPAEELSRPSSKLVQMVSPTPPEDHGAAAGAAGGTGAGAGAGPDRAMLSETLGDLYLRQGFKAEAADVYRRLLTQRPADETLKQKLDALESPPAGAGAAEAGAESAGAWLRRVAASRLRPPGAPPEPPPAPAPVIAEVEPPLSAPPAPPTPPLPSPLETAFAYQPAETSGEPAHPAHDAFSLDQIFGSPDAPPAASTSQAAPAAPAPSPGASFDEFFGAPPDQGSVRPATGAPDEPAAGGEEDLSAFNAWLQGLKH